MRRVPFLGAVLLPAALPLLGQAAIAQAPAAGPTAGQAAATVRRCSSPDPAHEQQCYTAELDARLSAAGPAAALKLLDALSARDPDVRRDGHMYAHRIGISALKSPDQVGRIFATCTPAYQSGCYHGVIQGYFIAVEKAGGSATTETVDALCADHRAAANAFLLFQCTHGLGHGLDILHRHDLPKALAGCDLLSRGDERQMCYAGAFMENIVDATMPHHVSAPKVVEPPAAHIGHGDHATHGTAQAPPGEPPFKALDPNDLHYPCSKFDEKYLTACYTIQTSAMLHHLHGDVARVGAECGRAPEKARDTCFLSLGRDVSTIALGNHAEAVRLCGLAPEAYRPTCHGGVVASIVNMNADPAEGIPYCRAVPDLGGKRACYIAVGFQALGLPDGAALRERACKAAEPAMMEACTGHPPRDS